MLLVAIVTGASAGDVTIGWTEVKVLPACGGMVKITGDENTTITSSGMAVVKNADANSTGKFTFTSLAPGYTIKSIDFTEGSSDKVVSVTPSVEGTLSGPTSKKYTFTPEDKTLTEISFDIEAKKNSSCYFKVINVVLTTSSTDVFEKMTITSISNSVVGYTNSAGENAKSILTSNITSGSTGRIQVKKDRYIQLSSETNNIKYIAIRSYQDAAMVFNAEQGTFSNSNFSWTPGTESYKTVKLNGPTDNTSFNITDVFVIMEPSAPVVKHSVAYNLGDGTSATGAPTQADVAEGAMFTVANAPTDLVPPTGKEFKCWNDGTNDYNAGAEYTMGESDVEFTAVYQNETVKYAVEYALNGGTGTAPTQADTEEGGKFNLAAAPTRDFYTFAGWKCNVDKVTYNAGAEYEMTAAPTTFTAQWTGPSYSSTIDFAANSATAPAIATLLASGNMISDVTGEWEALTAGKEGYGGFKVKKKDASLKFLAQAGKHVTITLGSVANNVTLKKNGTTAETILGNSGNTKMSVVAFDAGEEDVLVELVTSTGSTVTLSKIAIEDALASTDVTVGETGFATIGLPYATKIPANVTAYSLSAISSTAVTLSSAIEAGTTIPANKGFIIVAAPKKYTFNQFANDTWQGDIANKLEATGSSAKVAAAEGDYYYFAIIGTKKVGFKKCAANASLAANKAYLPGSLVPAASTTLSISFEGEETAINGVAEEASDAAPVKVVKNGQLFIGNYNVAGAQVK